ncbi:3-phosphoglycerate dehydrogenase [candidate division KSB1 bacterium]|nr:MAG: 3-phosphoglycerate dehydrogenase [candidate division KSB1 bacterium]
MAKILITDGMDKNAIAALKQLGHDVTEQFYPEPDLIKEIGKFECVVVRSATKITKPVIDAASSMKLIIRGGVGVDNIEVAYAKSKGIEVQNTPGASSASVAELALALMFAIAREVPAADKTMKDGKWEKKAFSKGMEVGGKVLGLVGLGRIGASLAEKARGVGMFVMAYDKFPNAVRDKSIPLHSKAEVIEKADFISMHIPFDKAAGPEITAADFDKMKKGVVIINCARGGVVDEDALLANLNSGKVRGAGIDVWVGEPAPRADLAAHPKVVAIPHVGAATVEAQERVGGEVVEVVKGFFK